MPTGTGRSGAGAVWFPSPWGMRSIGGSRTCQTFLSHTTLLPVFTPPSSDTYRPFAYFISIFASTLAYWGDRPQSISRHCDQRFRQNGQTVGKAGNDTFSLVKLFTHNHVSTWPCKCVGVDGWPVNGLWTASLNLCLWWTPMGPLNIRHRLLQMVLSMTLMSVVHTGYSEARYRDA